MPEMPARRLGVIGRRNGSTVVRDMLQTTGPFSRLDALSLDHLDDPASRLTLNLSAPGVESADPALLPMR